MLYSSMVPGNLPSQLEILGQNYYDPSCKCYEHPDCILSKSDQGMQGLLQDNFRTKFIGLADTSKAKATSRSDSIYRAISSLVTALT